MSEKDELKKFKEKLDRKYGKIAKKRLNIINKTLWSDKSVIDMSNDEFDDFIVEIKKEKTTNENRKQQLENYQRNQQINNQNIQRNQFNNQQRGF